MKNPMMVLLSMFFVAMGLALVSDATGRPSHGPTDEIGEAKDTRESRKEWEEMPSNAMAIMIVAGNQDDCEDAQLLKSQLYWTNQYLTTYDDVDKAETSIAKCKEYLKAVKSKCPKFDASAFEKELAGYEKTWAQKKGSADQQQNADQVLESASSAFNDLLYNVLGTSSKGMFKKKENAQRLYDECKKLDYPGRKKQLDDLLAANADLKTQATGNYGGYTQFMKGFEQFNQYVDPYLTGEINAAIEEGYAQKAKGKNFINNALEASEAAVITADAALLVLPDQAAVLRLRKDAQKSVDGIQKELGATVYTSDFHKNNAGKIVFSKSPIVIKQENVAAMVQDFTGRDPVYALCYFKGPIESVAYNWEVAVRIYVDDQEKMYRRFNVSKENKANTWADLEIVPDPATSKQSGCVEYSKALASISPRNHTIKVEFWDKEFVNLMATGSFNLDASEGLETLQATANALRKKQLESVRLPAAGMRNAALEKEMMDIWAKEYTPLRCVITDTEWKYKRHEITGVILYRYLSTALAVKDASATCKILYTSFNQKFNGSTYGKTEFGAMGDSEEIDCVNVNK